MDLEPTSRLLKLLLIVCACVSRGAAAGESPALSDGLRAELGACGSPDRIVRRVDRALVFHWGDGSPDPRLDPGPFCARWSGLLLVPDDGAYRLLADLEGDLVVRIDGRVVLEAAHARRRATGSASVALEYGYRVLEVDYSRPGRRGTLRLYWESGAMPIEALGDGALFHPGAGEDGDPGEDGPDLFTTGRRWAAALRCAACHFVPGLPAPTPAPSLVDAGWTLDPDALRLRLARGRPTGESVADGARMPRLDLDDRELRGLAAWLEASGRAAGVAPPAGDRERPTDVDPPAAGGASERRGDGRRLILERGCLGCHRLDGRGHGGPFSAGPLTGVGRGPAALRRWLGEPGDGPAARHPVELDLSSDERRAVADYLISRGAWRPPAPRPHAALPPGGRGGGTVALGARVVVSRRCAACHELPASPPPGPPLAAPPPLHREARLRWERSCVDDGAGGGRREGSHPRFVVGEAVKAALVHFVENVSPRARMGEFEEGRFLLAARGCLGCHPRSGRAGLASVAADLAAREPGFRGLAGALRAPSLDGVGDKLEDGALRAALGGGGSRRRPWLRVRMPRFRHDEREERALLAYLREGDRVPPLGVDATPDATLDAASLLAAGHRLVGPHGFGCNSCHVIAGTRPEGVAYNVRGPELAGLGSHLRRHWFHRWLKDPSRRRPGIEMPAISVALPGVLDGVLDRQLDAIWHALDSPDFNPPPASGRVRELVVAPGGPSLVVRDVFRRRGPFGKGWTPRGLAVGLTGGVHLLYDLDHGALVAWWSDVFARQMTQGKSWLWEPAGTPVLPRLPAVAPVAIDAAHGAPAAGSGPLDGVDGWPAVWKLESWRHTGDDRLELAYSVACRDGFALRVTERLERLPRDDGAGFTRAWRIDGAPPEARPVLRLAFGERAGVTEGPPGSGSFVVTGPLGRVRLAVEPASAAATARRLDWTPDSGARNQHGPDRGVVLEFEIPRREGTPELAVVYRSPSSAIPSPVVPPAGRTTSGPVVSAAPRESRTLDLVPGFRATRLPLDRSILPTGFAFLPDGGVVVTSLTGDVVLLRDVDGDGLEETATLLADRLSAPFGVLVDGDGLIVSHKPELLRLTDASGDGWFERGEVVGSGWGFTHDYHDWSFGLVRQGDGYLVLLGSDYAQDGRPAGTTRWRGRALRINAVPSGEGDARVEPIASGLRYTVGLAANAAGEVFFTDNQGVANTFNEINRLRPGAHYGVRSLDEKASADIVSVPPAIALPHPWVRSVNGITFLEADGAFGPFEGHGVGCEYDNRKLVRFTLDRVGGAIQGACYPFSLGPVAGSADGDAGFLGPLSCAVSPSGELYVGNLRDSGWGGGNNVGSIVRLRREGEAPLGILELRARENGFEIIFTGEVAAAAASEPESYEISGYRRIWEGEYGTPDRDRHRLTVERVDLHESGRRLRLQTSGQRSGFLYEVRVRSAVSPTAAALWPAVGYYTLTAR